MTLRTLNYGNYGIFLIMGNAGFCPSTVSCRVCMAALEFAKRTVGVPAKYRGTSLLLSTFHDLTHLDALLSST